MMHLSNPPWDCYQSPSHSPRLHTLVSTAFTHPRAHWVDPWRPPLIYSIFVMGQFALCLRYVRLPRLVYRVCTHITTFRRLTSAQCVAEAGNWRKIIVREKDARVQLVKSIFLTRRSRRPPNSYTTSSSAVQAKVLIHSRHRSAVIILVRGAPTTTVMPRAKNSSPCFYPRLRFESTQTLDPTYIASSCAPSATDQSPQCDFSYHHDQINFTNTGDDYADIRWLPDSHSPP